MAMINCSECGAEISSKADSCLKCGNPIKNKTNEEALKGMGSIPACRRIIAILIILWVIHILQNFNHINHPN